MFSLPQQTNKKHKPKPLTTFLRYLLIIQEEPLVPLDHNGGIIIKHSHSLYAYVLFNGRRLRSGLSNEYTIFQGFFSFAYSYLVVAAVSWVGLLWQQLLKRKRRRGFTSRKSQRQRQLLKRKASLWGL